MNPWLALAGAIILEVSGTISMKLSDGFTKLVPSVLIFVFYAASFAILTLALKKIDIGIAYAIWAGVGTALIAVIGVLYFKEPYSIMKVFSIFLIIAGVVGLNLSGLKH
ncbi:DMT family transporter [Motiliproteus sp.]|uniref:DMT family transporter n=1 Tax=Motiliproteus sp. TaxID=1898955 RepID=UPI003BA9DCF1